MLDKRTIKRLEWRGIEKRAYAFSEFCFDAFGISGEAGLMLMQKVEKPFFVHSFGKRLAITKEGYSWLHLAPLGENFWATVMFDDSGRLFQYYFDIVHENHALSGGEAWFTDLFLDVVMARGGEIACLDEDELDKALRAGTITQEMYALAMRTRERLLRLIDGNEPEFCSACEALRNSLLSKIQ